jgi:hypothetical protein
MYLQTIGPLWNAFDMCCTQHIWLYPKYPTNWSQCPCSYESSQVPSVGMPGTSRVNPRVETRWPNVHQVKMDSSWITKAIDDLSSDYALTILKMGSIFVFIAFWWMDLHQWCIQYDNCVQWFNSTEPVLYWSLLVVKNCVVMVAQRAIVYEFCDI